jgi:hypothetical protein
MLHQNSKYDLIALLLLNLNIINSNCKNVFWGDWILKIKIPSQKCSNSDYHEKWHKCIRTSIRNNDLPSDKDYHTRIECQATDMMNHLRIWYSGFTTRPQFSQGALQWEADQRSPSHVENFTSGLRKPCFASACMRGARCDHPCLSSCFFHSSILMRWVQFWLS